MLKVTSVPVHKNVSLFFFFRAMSSFPHIHLMFSRCVFLSGFNITALIEFTDCQIQCTSSHARVTLDNETFLSCEEIQEKVSLFLL